MPWTEPEPYQRAQLSSPAGGAAVSAGSATCWLLAHAQQMATTHPEGAALRIPQPRVAVLSTSGHYPARRAARHAVHPPRVVAGRLHQARRKVPHPHCGIFRHCDRKAPLAGDHRRVHGSRVALQGAQKVSRLKAEGQRRAVACSRQGRGCGASRREGSEHGSGSSRRGWASTASAQHCSISATAEDANTSGRRSKQPAGDCSSGICSPEVVTSLSLAGDSATSDTQDLWPCRQAGGGKDTGYQRGGYRKWMHEGATQTHSSNE